MSLDQYLAELRDALRTSGAHSFYFPTNRAEREAANLRLARELAVGLRGFDEREVEKRLGTLYGMLVVANSFDQTGVAVDNKEWLAEIRNHL